MTWSGWALSPLLLVLAVACQATVLQGRLDLVFFLTLGMARLRGCWGGTLTGWLGGLLTGALRGNLSLPMALLYGLVGFLAGIYFENQRPRWLEVLGLVAGLTLLMAAGEGILMLWLGLPLEPARALILPALGLNLVALTPLLSRP